MTGRCLGCRRKRPLVWLRSALGDPPEGYCAPCRSDMRAERIERQRALADAAEAARDFRLEDLT